MRQFLSKYRGPLATGLVLFVGTWLWAWSQTNDARRRERDQCIRHAEGLAKGLSIAATRLSGTGPETDARFRQQLRDHLRLRRPIRFVVIMRGPVTIAQEGRVPAAFSHALRPGLYTKDSLFVARAPLVSRPQHVADKDASRQREPSLLNGPPLRDRHPPPSEQERRPPDQRLSLRLAPPWDWLPGKESGALPGGSAESLQLLVGFDAAINPRALREFIVATTAAMLVTWAAIAALVIAWSRSIRSRDLAAALDAERRERARLGEMSLAAAGLAHETKNPLGLILGLSQRLVSNPGISASGRETAEQIMDAADRAAARLSDFINFASLPTPAIGDVSAPEVLGRVEAALRPDFDQAGIQLVVASDDLRLLCDSTMLEQVLINLLLNSLQASKTGTTTTVRIERQRDSATLIVADQGHGIDPHLLPDIFKPYITGHTDGHGLGLAIVKRIAEQHGWSIAVRNETAGGATFTLSGIRVVKRSERGQ